MCLESKEEAKVVEIQLPPIGEALKNITVSPTAGSDPVLLPDSSYPEWMWKARGPCRAVLRSDFSVAAVDSGIIGDGGMSELKKYLRTENRKSIRKNNSLLKGASQ